ncbi:hypothetical protein BU26DRAFT_465659, partial [Trematosphaeria pertusa]
RIPHTAVFAFNADQHTLGNLVSQRLLKYRSTTFSAYKVPHPLNEQSIIRVTTDGSITPKDAVIRICEDIGGAEDTLGDLEVLSNSFAIEWLGKRIAVEEDRKRLERDAE